MPAIARAERAGERFLQTAEELEANILRTQADLSVLRGAGWFYIWFMRGTPLILQLVFLYDALPAVGIRLDSFTTAVIGFTLNEAAFCGEIIHGGMHLG